MSRRSFDCWSTTSWALGASTPAIRCASAFEAIEADPKQLLAMLTCDGEVAGKLQLTFIPGLSHMGARRGGIEAVRIARTRRGAGLSGRMIEWAVEGRVPGGGVGGGDRGGVG